MSIKFTANEIRYIALFENMTGAMVKDCIIDDEHGKVTFVVKNGELFESEIWIWHSFLSSSRV